MTEQEKLANVIEGLEEVKHFIKTENLPAHSLKALLNVDDAIALLKAQEPVFAFKLQDKIYIGRTGIAYDGSCGNCNGYLMRAWRACPLCGKVIKWK